MTDEDIKLKKWLEEGDYPSILTAWLSDLTFLSYAFSELKEELEYKKGVSEEWFLLAKNGERITVAVANQMVEVRGRINGNRIARVVMCKKCIDKEKYIEENPKATFDENFQICKLTKTFQRTIDSLEERITQLENNNEDACPCPGCAYCGGK